MITLRWRPSSSKGHVAYAFSLWGFATLFVVFARSATAQQPLSPADTSLLVAVVRAVGSTVGNAELRVDPRPLRADPSLNQATPETLAPVASSLVAAREALLALAGFHTADALRDRECAFSRGTPPPPPPPGTPAPVPSSTTRPECANRNPFRTIILGLPRPGGVDYPPGQIIARKPLSPTHLWTTRVIEYLPHGYWISDVVARRKPGGDWQILNVEAVDGVVS